MKKPSVLHRDLNLNPRIALLFILVATASLAGCGGGGGDSSSSSNSSSNSSSSNPPTASSSAVSTTEDMPTSSTLNASDADGDPLTYSITRQGTKGIVNITNPATGAFTYTPNPNEYGTDSFTFKANDGSADSNTATMTVTITAVADAPVALSGSLATLEDTSAGGTLSASDAEGDPLIYSVVGQGARGTVIITNPATGAFTYTPNPNENGSDSFTFKAHDGSANSNIATVTVTIAAVADAPVALSGSLATDEDTSAGGTLSASDADGDPLTYSVVGQGTRGTVIITNPATGAFTYTPNPNENGSDSFTFKANDGSANSNIAIVTIAIAAVADAPVALSGSLTTDEDTSAGGTLSASDADGDPLTYSVVGQGARGTVTITNPATGAFTYTPNLNENGSDSFTFKANDGSADSNTATVSVTINPVNDPPVATGSCGTTPQAQTLAGTLSATDLETPTLLTYSLNADGSGGLGPIWTTKNGKVTITNATTGAFTYEPDTAAGDKRGTDTFAYQVSDPDSGTGSATETVVVDQKIMPLGDSITEGHISGLPIDEKVGYRKPLYDTLVASSFTFDFVGSLSNGQAAALTDADHEGHGGWTATEIAWGQTGFPTDGVQAWLNSNPADIVLLHAGTNQLSSTTATDIADILDQIDLWENSANGNPVTVILALIIDRDNMNDPTVAAFNNSVQIMANSRITAGDDIVIVDQQAAVNYTTNMSDTLHPNNSGYAKMATTWFNALAAGVVDKCP